MVEIKITGQKKELQYFLEFLTEKDTSKSIRQSELVEERRDVFHDDPLGANPIFLLLLQIPVQVTSRFLYDEIKRYLDERKIRYQIQEEEEKKK